MSAAANRKSTVKIEPEAGFGACSATAQQHSEARHSSEERARQSESAQGNSGPERVRTVLLCYAAVSCADLASCRRQAACASASEKLSRV